MRIRPLIAADRVFLEEMIVQAAFPPGRAPAFAEAVRTPHVVPWIDGWPGAGDLGVLAEDNLRGAVPRRVTS